MARGPAMDPQAPEALPPSPTRVTVRAGAKVNPLLVIHGRRGDGYHELGTLMLGLDLWDDVTVALSSQGATSVASTGPFASSDIATDATNLAARGAQAAVDALAAAGHSTAAASQPQHLTIQLYKGIPSRAGLGGGSSDAAAAALATLELLSPAWSTDSSKAPKIEAAVAASLGRIGADCAFFFCARHQGAAWSSGRGEQIDTLDAVPPWHIVVATPEIDCATPKVYGALGFSPMTPEALEQAAQGAALPVHSDLLSAPASAARALLRNDLEPPAARAFPGLSDWRALLDAAGLDHFQLAGSGSSFFGLFDSRSEAAAASATLESHAQERQLGLRHTAVLQPTGPRLLHLIEGPRV